jgi:hypothetical protein
MIEAARSSAADHDRVGAVRNGADAEETCTAAEAGVAVVAVVVTAAAAVVTAVVVTVTVVVVATPLNAGWFRCWLGNVLARGWCSFASADPQADLSSQRTSVSQ